MPGLGIPFDDQLLTEPCESQQQLTRRSACHSDMLTQPERHVELEAE